MPKLGIVRDREWGVTGRIDGLVMLSDGREHTWHLCPDQVGQLTDTATEYRTFHLHLFSPQLAQFNNSERYMGLITS